MSEIPGINSLIELVVDGERVYRSRVEARADDVLTVAAPIGAGDLEPPEVGSILTVGWPVARSRHVVPVRLTELIRQQQPPRWVVEVAGDVRAENRRKFVRGAAGGSVHLYRTTGADRARPTVGGVIDLSEGGLRCHLAACDFQPGEPVRVHLPLGGDPVDTAGAVASLRPPPQGPGSDVVVTFDLGERDAQKVRRYLYQLELEERRKQRYAD
ncbi:PilZ domain-containing protein [Planosporangium sp. 12N6]|uniref:PilZ domain-containing protein n=1 Tax=Planosporangium spinosum TaxID=3402278 RepID=UPI003CF862AD